jgi:hypothetical protein
MTETVSREIRLKRRPVGMPQEDDFELAEVKLPEITEGQLRVRNIYMSVDPYMRGRMVDRESYVPPFQVGQSLEGGCVGQVDESRTDQAGVLRLRWGRFDKSDTGSGAVDKLSRGDGYAWADSLCRAAGSRQAQGG